MARLLSILCDLFFLSFGCWTLLVILGYFSGLSFNNILVLSVFVIPAFNYLFVTNNNHRQLWPESTTIELICLSFFILCAIILTLCLNRPDADDERYLGIAISVLDYPDISIKTIPLFERKLRYILSAYEFLKSSVSKVSSIPILYSYYLIIPAIFSIFVVLINWKLLNLLVKKRWIIGLLFFFVIMLSWGDVHRTYANFGFVRLFQGKACFVSIIVPGIIYYFLKYVETHHTSFALLLILTIISGFGLTPTGLIIGPLTLAILLISSGTNNILYRNQSYLHLFIGVGIICCLLLCGYFWGDNREAVHTARGIQQHTTNLEMLQFVLGNGYLGGIALMCFILSPIFIQDSALRDIFTKFSSICLLLLVIPWTSELLAKSTYPTISWRWLWMLPIPLSMCIVMSSLPKFYAHKNRIAPEYIITLFLILFFILCSNRLVISDENYTKFDFPDFKLDNNSKIWLRSYKEFGYIEGNVIHLENSNKAF